MSFGSRHHFGINGYEFNFADVYRQTGPSSITRLGGSLITVAGWMDIMEGRLSGLARITGNLRILGELDFGDTIGTLYVTGNYVQDGKLYVKVSGDGPYETDFLDVGGTADLAGEVLVALVNGYDPGVGTHTSLFLGASGQVAENLLPPLGWSVFALQNWLGLQY